MLNLNTEMNKKIFITTTLPYANGKGHIGASFEFILADALNRYFKLNGYSTFFNTGLDQNGSKIPQKAKELGLSIDEYLTQTTKDWVNFCTLLNIDYDNFYQTSSDAHAKNVVNIWNYFLKNGDIYEKEYTGKYCLGCESFKLDKDLVDGKCLDHPTTEIETISEKNYFFNLYKYKDSIYKWLESNPISESDKNELINYIEDYKELSVSRKKTDNIIGIGVPNRPDQIIYIWTEALLNYLFAIGENNWNDVTIIQLCGKDNLRFQAQIFQCFLASLNKKHSDYILVHGTILDKEGKKMSKTLGNTIDPIDQLEKYGLDAVRYYSLCGLSTTYNSNWNEEDLINLFNSDIANDWGNLVSRVLHLVDTKLNNDILNPEDSFKSTVEAYINDSKSFWDKYKIREALQKTNELVKYANKYINDEKPWNSENYKQVLGNLYYLLKEVNKLYIPVFPDKCKETDIAIELKKKVILFNKI